MIQSLDAFLQGLANYASRRGLMIRWNEARIAGALRLATELAQGRPEDEPAALIFALSREGRALGAAWEDYPLLCARNMARAQLQAELDAWPGDVALEELRLRVAWGRATFDEVRAFVAGRLRTLR